MSIINGLDFPIANYFQAAFNYEKFWEPAVEKMNRDGADALTKKERRNAIDAFDNYGSAVEYLRVRARMQLVHRWEEVWEDEDYA